MRQINVITKKGGKKMKHKRVKLIVMLLLVLGLTGAHAQTRLYIKEKSGTSSSLDLSTIRKLSFSGGNLMVNKTDGNSSTFGLNDLRFLSFIDFSSGIQPISNLEEMKFKLFPNPASDEIQMFFLSGKSGQLRIEIIDLQGKILHLEMIPTQNGANTATINISQLQRGMYMCRVRTDNKFEAIKFIKN